MQRHAASFQRTVCGEAAAAETVADVVDANAYILCWLLTATVVAF